MKLFLSHTFHHLWIRIYEINSSSLARLYHSPNDQWSRAVTISIITSLRDCEADESDSADLDDRIPTNTHIDLPSFRLHRLGHLWTERLVKSIVQLIEVYCICFDRLHVHNIGAATTARFHPYTRTQPIGEGCPSIQGFLKRNMLGQGLPWYLQLLQ